MADREVRSHLSAFAGRLRNGQKRRVLTLAGNRITTQGVNRTFWADLYYNSITASWAVFVFGAAFVFFFSNLVFALVLDIGTEPVANAHSLLDLFFFSLETTTTVGYGDMHPQTAFGHSISGIEGFSSLFVTAALTGMIFARFSLPRARLLFARNPIVMRRNGVPTLTFRVANARGNFISEATAKVWVLMAQVDAEGRRLVGFQPLRLIKNENPAFVLSWTLFHPITDDSPLFGLTEEEIKKEDVNFVVSITGLDETSAQIMHARETFSAQDVRFDHEFVDMFFVGDDGERGVDYNRIHDTQPVPAAAWPAPGA